MSDLSAKFEALESQLTSQQTAILAAMTAISDAIGLVNTNLETLNANGATNTRYLLQAIAANSPCLPCPTPSLIVPPIGTTPQTVDTEHCKRMQALIYTLRRIMVLFDSLSAIGTGFSPVLITDSMREVLDEVLSGASIPTVSWYEALTIVGDAVAYVASNLLVGGSLVFYFNAFADDLLAPLYAATTAEEGQAIYREAVGASAAPAAAQTLMAALGYNDLFSAFYNDSIDVDTLGFDGSICAPAGDCITVTVPDDPGTGNEGHGYGRITVADLTFSGRITAETTIRGSIDLFVQDNPFAGTNLSAGVEAVLWDFPHHTHIDSLNPVLNFTVEFCNLAPE